MKFRLMEIGSDQNEIEKERKMENVKKKQN